MQKALRAFVKLKQALSLAHAHALHPLGLGPLQAGIIRVLDAEGACSAARLARAVASDPAAVNRALGPLIKKGLLKRAADPADRRSGSLSLSAGPGRAAAARVAAARRGLERDLLGGLPKADWPAFAKNLERVADHVQALNARRQLNED